MDRAFGASINEVDDFNNFDAPMEGGPMPRWQRKAIEAAQKGGKTPTKRTPGTTPQSDRFIPNRSAMDIDVSRMALKFGDKENSGDKDTDRLGKAYTGESGGDYNSALASSLLSSESISSTKILAFKNKAPNPREGYVNSLRVLYSQNAPNAPRRNKMRQIPQVPERILDAPDLLDDYYLNLLDWSAEGILAIALGQTVYLWNSESGSIDELCQVRFGEVDILGFVDNNEGDPSTEKDIKRAMADNVDLSTLSFLVFDAPSQLSGPDDYVSSLSWIQSGNFIAVGTNSAQVQLYDVDRMARVRNMHGHAARVGSLAWNGPILSSGSRDATVVNHDVRIQNHHVATLSGHHQEVCGLKWSPCGTYLASGGNDNQLLIWETGNTGRPKMTFNQHTAAVKALAWCPWQRGLLASGGGTADRTLRFWNVGGEGACVNSVDTKSQVCSIVWNPNEKELVSSHGFSQNQLTLWRYPSLARVAELTGHSARVLHLSLSPDGQTVASAAADETLRFWKVFAPPVKSKAENSSGLSFSSSRSALRGVNIR